MPLHGALGHRGLRRHGRNAGVDAVAEFIRYVSEREQQQLLCRGEVDSPDGGHHTNGHGVPPSGRILARGGLLSWGIRPEANPLAPGNCRGR